MDVRILDLDGSLLAQEDLLDRWSPAVAPLSAWGPRIRLGCSFRRFRKFEQELAGIWGSGIDDRPGITFCGSGDFHHVSLALVRRQQRPFNLLVLDNHPDWMHGVPFLHCGTWVYHAARLPMVRRIFHVGGDVDFDNSWRWMAPWDLLRGRKITVFPARRRFQRGPWLEIDHEPVRSRALMPVGPGRLDDLLRPFHGDLARWPLYVSIDKDVLEAAAAAVNWDSGHLTLPELTAVVEAFVRRAQALVGLDIVGDWSPVRLQGSFRHALHLTEHPILDVDPDAAAHLNERTNLHLLDRVRQSVTGAGELAGYRTAG